jgi:hypothetical protein
MQDHRNGGVPSRPPAHDSPEHRAQRMVLLELVVCPPAEGDSLHQLMDRLDLPPHAVEPAVIALELAGLAAREGARVRTSLAARYFEHLWPVRP